MTHPMKNINTLIVISFLLIGCGSKTYLTEDEKRYNPYKEGDVLIFQNNENKLDTIFINSINDNLFPDAPGPLKYYNESIIVSSKLTESNRKINCNDFLEIRSKTAESPTIIDFGLCGNGYRFIDGTRTINQLNKIKPIELQIMNKPLNDILTIANTGKYKTDIANSIENIYWSKSIGYVGFDKADSSKYRLVNKYYRNPRIKLIVISNEEKNEKLISTFTSIQEIQQTFNSINWNKTHKIRLQEPNGNWIEVSGENITKKFSCKYKEYGKTLDTTENIKTKDELLEILNSYFRRDKIFKKIYKFEKGES